MFTRLSRRSTVLLALGSAVTAIGYCGATGNEYFYKGVVMPCVRTLDAETAHVFAVKCAKMGLVPKPKDREEDSSVMETSVFGLKFSNPVGLAAGFDKNAECIDGMLKSGFGFVEIGSVTPKPQEGNPKPRVFRLVEDNAVINRYGFNSHGLEIVRKRLQTNFETRCDGIVGVNVGRNKMTADPVRDFLIGVKELGALADYIVINVSSPNTPGLRKMQGKEELENLISKAIETRNKLRRRPPLLVKIAPDLTDDDKADISEVITGEKCKVDGLIVSNTTISRPPSLQSINKTETGGLSGKPLKEMSTKAVSDMYRLTKGQLAIIGVGGISCGQDAYEKIRAGASLIQLYTALTYEGPPVAAKIRKELADLLRRDGYSSVAEAVGAAHSQGLSSPKK